MNNTVLQDIKKGQKFYVVDLESVSFLSKEGITMTAKDDTKYHKMPFLYLVMSYCRNQTLDWALENFQYNRKTKTGSWMIYEFERV